MTLNERWNRYYQETLNFIITQQRRPSKHYAEDLKMFNWIKYNKKLLARGKLQTDRIERFKILLAVANRYIRINQYVYIHPEVLDEDLEDILSGEQ